MFTQRATGVRTELVGAGLCSARREAVSLREFTANPYVLTPFVVGADAHIGPLGINEFAENYRKIAAFCGRTESSAPAKRPFSDALARGASVRVFCLIGCNLG